MEPTSRAKKRTGFHIGRTSNHYSQRISIYKCNGYGSLHTRSGVLSMRPCSNATPRSMCTTSAVSWSIRIFMEWRSPSPTMYPTWTHENNRQHAVFLVVIQDNEVSCILTTKRNYHWACCHTSCVSKSTLEPISGQQESLEKEVVHYRPGYLKERGGKEV